MIFLTVLVLSYFFFCTKPGKNLFGVLVSNLFYTILLIINPISLLCGFGVYLIIRSM